MGIVSKGIGGQRSMLALAMRVGVPVVVPGTIHLLQVVPDFTWLVVQLRCRKQVNVRTAASVQRAVFINFAASEAAVMDFFSWFVGPSICVRDWRWRTVPSLLSVGSGRSGRHRKTAN